MKRAIQKWVDDYVTEFIIEKDLKAGQVLTLSYSSKDDKTLVQLHTKKKSRKKID